MDEEKIIAYDSAKHKEKTISMFLEYRDWFLTGFKENTGIDFLKVTGRNTSDFKISDFINTLGPLLSLKPPHGILLVIETDEELAGMGIIRKLSSDTGEVKRMLTRPKYRRRGFARHMLNELLRVGREIGCSRFLLDSPKWASASHGLYKSFGFSEVDEYPESEIPSALRDHWVFMEKIDSSNR